MFDVGFWEITLIGIVALVIVGPERLPGLARTAGLWVGKGRRMIADVKRDIDREIKTSEMAEIAKVKSDLDDIQKTVSSSASEITEEANLKELDEVANQVSSELNDVEQVATDATGDSAKKSAGKSAATPASSGSKKASKKKLSANKKTASPEKAATRKAVTKKLAAKKAVSKKATTKKAAANKTTAKKTASKAAATDGLTDAKPK